MRVGYQQNHASHATICPDGDGNVNDFDDAFADATHDRKSIRCQLVRGLLHKPFRGLVGICIELRAAGEDEERHTSPPENEPLQAPRPIP